MLADHGFAGQWLICGNIGNYHRSNLARIADVRIIAVADAFGSRREKFAAELDAEYKETGLVKAYADFREILARPDIDAVFIGAHDNWHTPMAIAAMRAGKDVYCQKPLALDFSLTKLLRQTALESRRVFQFGTQFRSSARYRQMVRNVRNGYIGKLEKMYVWSRGVKWDAANYHVKPYGSSQEIPVPEDLDYDAWMGCSEMVSYTADRCTNWVATIALKPRSVSSPAAPYTNSAWHSGETRRIIPVRSVMTAPARSRRRASSGLWNHGM